MPELPEVEHGRRLAHAVAVGRRVVGVRVEDDRIVVDGARAAEVERALLGAAVTGTGRRGKHLWIELDRRPWLLLHFGMTGELRARGDDPLQLESSAREVDRSWPPRFCKLWLELDDGGELAFVNKRRLGRVRLREDPLTEDPIASLGFDPLLELPGAEAFAELLTRRRGLLKGLLLDQSFAAGVGNWIADEVLYQARLDPRRRAHALTADEAERLREALGEVVSTAVSVDARKDAFPDHWLFHHRWGRPEGARTAAGEAIEFLTVAGRTTAWVPGRQG